MKLSALQRAHRELIALGAKVTLYHGNNCPGALLCSCIIMRYNINEYREIMDIIIPEKRKLSESPQTPRAKPEGSRDSPEVCS